MYSADGIGRTGHRLLALALLAVGALGLGLVLSQTGMPAGYHLLGLTGMTAAIIAMATTLWIAHRPGAPAARERPRAAKVPTPPLEPTGQNAGRSKANAADQGATLFEYTDGDDGLDDLPHPDDAFQGTVPRATVVDERPPPPPVPDMVRTRHDFTAKYTQSTPEVRQILAHGGSARPQRVQARLADPSMHPSQLPPATMRGKCSECDSLLLAPTHRPIELECPACHRVTLLE